jgi:hypothetical protein
MSNRNSKPTAQELAKAITDAQSNEKNLVHILSQIDFVNDHARLTSFNYSYSPFVLLSLEILQQYYTNRSITLPLIRVLCYTSRNDLRQEMQPVFLLIVKHYSKDHKVLTHFFDLIETVMCGILIAPSKTIVAALVTLLVETQNDYALSLLKLDFLSNFLSKYLIMRDNPILITIIANLLRNVTDQPSTRILIRHALNDPARRAEIVPIVNEKIDTYDDETKAVVLTYLCMACPVSEAVPFIHKHNLFTLLPSLCQGVTPLFFNNPENQVIVTYFKEYPVEFSDNDMMKIIRMILAGAGGENETELITTCFLKPQYAPAIRILISTIRAYLLNYNPVGEYVETKFSTYCAILSKYISKDMSSLDDQIVITVTKVIRCFIVPIISLCQSNTKATMSLSEINSAVNLLQSAADMSVENRDAIVKALSIKMVVSSMSYIRDVTKMKRVLDYMIELSSVKVMRDICVKELSVKVITDIGRKFDDQEVAAGISRLVSRVKKSLLGITEINFSDIDIYTVI